MFQLPVFIQINAKMISKGNVNQKSMLMIVAHLSGDHGHILTTTDSLDSLIAYIILNDRGN